MSWLAFLAMSYTEFEKDVHIFKEKSMEAIGTHNIRITPKVHALVRHASKYMRHTGAGARDAA